MAITKWNTLSIKPQFLIAGAPKCGTTSLAAALALHPDLYLPPIKEVMFFNKEENWKRGLEWYARYFDGDKICGEATPSYFASAKAMQRIRSVLPEVKLIYLMRNPIERAHSHYWFRQRAGIERRSMLAVLEAEQQRADAPGNYLLWPGRYTEHLRAFDQSFAAEQLLPLFLEDFKVMEEACFTRVYRFLDVAIVPSSLERRNAARVAKNQTLQRGVLDWVKSESSAKKVINALLPRTTRKRLWRGFNQLNSKQEARPELTAAEKALLLAYYQADIEQLAQRFDRDLRHWLS